jgi:hypothetical protein
MKKVEGATQTTLFGAWGIGTAAQQAPVPAVDALYICDRCDTRCKTAQALSVHIAWSHGNDEVPDDVDGSRQQPMSALVEGMLERLVEQQERNRNKEEGNPGNGQRADGDDSDGGDGDGQEADTEGGGGEPLLKRGRRGPQAFCLHHLVQVQHRETHGDPFGRARNRSR